MVANYGAGNSKEWVNIFPRYLSGTYTNQFIVMDYKAFTPDQPLPDETLMIVEEVPMTYRIHDISSIVNKQSYWPSFNVAYDPDIYIIANYNATDPHDSYDVSPRANQFRALQKDIHNEEDFKYAITYNKWQTDPLLEGSPKYGISSRYDLSM